VPTKFFSAQSVALILSLSCAIGVNAAPQRSDKAPSHPKHVMGIQQKANGIHGFGEVTPKLYRGGQPDLVGMKTLKQLGVDIVVNMRGGHNHAEEKAVNELGMKYVSIPWHCPLPSDKPFANFIKLVRDNPGKKIFVHCRLGDDRTGMAVAAYRMAEEGWSADEAMKEMQAFGFSGVHRIICPTLAHYEHSFPEHWKSGEAFEELRRGKSTAATK
jgi:protein tyrosine phosphatase (PTP) superfamily phosphohydrolase (DUF442 family)